MNNNARKLVSYALSISMIFNAATANSMKKVEPAILPEKFRLEELKEEKDMNLKKSFK